MLKWQIPTAMAMLVGILVLLGFLIPIGVLETLRFVLVRWAAVLGAFALLLAYFSLLRVHLQRIGSSKKITLKTTSLLIVLSALGSLALVVWQGPYGVWPQQLLRHILVPGESALLALTAVTLLLAAMRIFQTRRGIGSLVFIVVTLFSLFMAVPYLYPRFIQPIAELLDSMAASGMRGLMIGVALGTTLTGIRIILGIDRPHSDE